MVVGWLDLSMVDMVASNSKGFLDVFCFQSCFFGGCGFFVEVGFLLKKRDFLSSFICLGVLWGGKKSAKRLQDAKNVG